MPDDFVHLHVHSSLSTFDGYGLPEAFVERAASLGQKALALTEHGSMRSAFDLHVACEKHGVKPIYGVEAYVADDAEQRGLTKDEKAKILTAHPDASPEERKAILKRAVAARRSRDHVTLWAGTQEGLCNLFRLTSWSWNEGFYGNARIDLARLKRWSSGVIATTGCPGGIVSAPIRAGKQDVAVERAERLVEIFGSRLWVEIMPHALPGSETLQACLVEVARAFDLPLLGTQDAHYPSPADACAQEVMLCVQTNDSMSRAPKSLKSPDGRFAFDTDGYWLRSRAEMEAAWSVQDLVSRKDWTAALDNTNVLAEQCAAVLELHEPGRWLVAPELPSCVPDYDDWLLRLCLEGGADRFGWTMDSWPEPYLDRLSFELDRLRDFGFARYLIFVWDVIRWCREQGIRVGPGRGSAAGSLVCYLLRITSLDPLVHGLSFDRFIAPSRKGLPDVDTDVDQRRRQEVLEYLRRRYGEEHVAQITTINTFGGKQCLRDVCRVFGVSAREHSPVGDLIVTGLDEESKAGHDDLERTLRETGPGRRFAAEWPDVARSAVRLEGQVRATGTHAAGVVVSSVPVVDVLPLESRAKPGGGRAPVTAFEMDAVEKLGLVKADWLGLVTMTVIGAACDATGDDPDAIPADDPAVLRAFSDGDLIGVFQFDTPAGRRISEGFEFRSLADIATLTALNRPGPMKSGMAEEYLRRHADPALTWRQHPIVDACTKETHGVVVYQEQLIEIAKRLAGYSPVEADGFRKAVAKKIGLLSHEEKFVSGCVASGMEPDEAKKFFDKILVYGSYVFNKSHSFSYAWVAYLTQWLKVHRPREFFAALLANAKDEHDQMRIAAAARARGIPVRPPDVRFSESRISMVDGEIVGSSLDVHGVGKTAADAVAACRPYSDLLDFFERTRKVRKAVTLGTFRALAKATAFRGLFPSTRFLVVNAEVVWKALKKGVQPALDGRIDDWDADTVAMVASSVYPMFVGTDGVAGFDRVERAVRAVCEREVLSPGTAELRARSSALVFGRVVGHKVFGGEAPSARVTVMGTDGSTESFRVDGDLLARRSDLFVKSGTDLLVLLSGESGRRRAELAVLASEAASGSEDPLLRFLLRPERTRPKDPGLSVERAEVGARLVLEGMVARLRRHRDKNGEEMATIGLLGSHGYAPIYCFARDWRAVEGVVVGARVRIVAKKLDGGRSASTRIEVVRNQGA